jgi:hypothetical protein
MPLSLSSGIFSFKFPCQNLLLLMHICMWHPVAHLVPNTHNKQNYCFSEHSCFHWNIRTCYNFQTFPIIFRQVQLSKLKRIPSCSEICNVLLLKCWSFFRSTVFVATL